MQQRADEPRDEERGLATTPEWENRDPETAAAAANRARDDENSRRLEGSADERRPTIEPAGPVRNVTPIGTRREQTTTSVDSTSGPPAAHASLFPSTEAERFRADWQHVQAAFVDDPPNAIRQADELVSRTIARLGDVFAEERRKLEPQSGADAQASTEDLRQGLQRYRAFFDRLLSL